MIQFEEYSQNKISMNELVRGLDHGSLYGQTNKMVDLISTLINDCSDSCVTFVPRDSGAHDPAAATEEEISMPWSLGHVIVHTTASAEEAAAIAAELARGVPFRGGRSRSEVHWSSITTLAQCRSRLEESRRMRLASLDMWPDQPDLENTLVNHRGEEIDAVGNFMGGLTHEYSHLDQIKDIIDQGKHLRI